MRRGDKKTVRDKEENPPTDSSFCLVSTEAQNFGRYEDVSVGNAG